MMKIMKMMKMKMKIKKILKDTLITFKKLNKKKYIYDNFYYHKYKYIANII